MYFEFTINANSIIAFVGLLTSLGVLFALIKNYIHQVDKWNGYDGDIAEVKKKVDDTENNINTKITIEQIENINIEEENISENNIGFTYKNIVNTYILIV